MASTQWRLTLVLATAIALVSGQGTTTYAAQARWGQSSMSTTNPRGVLVYGGKVAGTGGYTYDSAPNTNDLLFLPLTSNFTTDVAPWTYIAGSQSPSTSQGPAAAWTGLSSLSAAAGDNDLLLFGGQVPADSIQSGNDSQWTIGITASSATIDQALLLQSVSTQPERRIRHTLLSATSGSAALSWAFGGMKSDGSKTPFSELWQYSSQASSPSTGTWMECPSGPAAVYDHASVTVSNNNSAIEMWSIGGVVPSAAGGMANMNKLWRFTPKLDSSNTLCGAWDVVEVQGSAPSVRRGHSVVALSSHQILLFGGASQDASDVYSDLWLLDLTSKHWRQLSPSGNGPEARWGHFMTRVGSEVILGFGYGAGDVSAPASPGPFVFNVVKNSWNTAFNSNPSDIGSSETSGSTGSSSGSTGSGWDTPNDNDPVDSLPTGSSSSHGTPPQPTVIGVTIGLLGILALAGGGAYYWYRKRQSNVWDSEASDYRRRFDHDQGGASEDTQNLTHSLHGNEGMAEVRHIGVGVYDSGPNPRKPFAGVGAGVGAFLAGRNQRRLASGGRKERFNMLADDDSDVWDVVDNSLGAEVDEVIDNGEEGQLTPRARYNNGEFNPRVTTRGGLRIWDGHEPEPTDNSKNGTLTSFLGRSLAPWSDDEGSQRGGWKGSEENEGSYSDPFADSTSSRNRTQSWGHGDDDASNRRSIPRFSSPPPSAQSQQSMDRSISFRSVDDVANTSNKTITPPLSIPNLGLTSFSNNVSPSSTDPLRRNPTWWDRLRQNSVESPSASLPIRDPATPPVLRGVQQYQHNPFSDPDTPLKGLSGPLSQPFDEHGALPEGVHFQGESQSSAKSGETATSSVIERLGRQMMVVERRRTASSGAGLESTASFPNTPEIESLPVQASSSQSTIESAETPGSVVWDGTLMWTQSPATSVEKEDDITPIASPRQTFVRPLSPKPRGPRLANPTSRQTTSNPAVVVDQHRSRSKPKGVMAMVQQFETKSEKKQTSGTTRTPPTSSLVPKRGGKIEHGLVMRPTLYVANPDRYQSSDSL